MPENRKEYVKTGIIEVKYSKYISQAFQVRNNADYADFYLVSKNDAQEQYERAKKFVFMIKEYILSKGLFMIRAMREDDIPCCVEIIRESFNTVAEEFGFTEENAPRFTAFATTEKRLLWQRNNEHRLMYVYVEDDAIIGYYSLLIQDNQECELNNLCVLPQYRHKQVGKELLEDAFINAKSLGCKKLNIGIVEENQILREWYEKYGFVHIRTEKFVFFPFTCGYMVKSL